MRLHFSLCQLLAFVSLVALACAGLARPAPLLASIIFTLAVGALFIAVLGAVARKGAARAFWIGFALCGWGYLWLAHWPDEDPWSFPSAWQLQTNGPLATTKLLRSLFDAMHPPPPTPAAGAGFFTVPPQENSTRMTEKTPLRLEQRGQGSTGPTLLAAVTDYDTMKGAFFRAGHALWAILLAWLGGQWTRHLYRTRSGTAKARV